MQSTLRPSPHTIGLLLLYLTAVHAAEPVGLAPLPPLPDRIGQESADWLLDATSFSAGAYCTDRPNEIALDNGLIRRTFRLSPNGATVGLDNLVSGATVVRAVRPEASVTIDGIRYDVGGLTGQPNHAFLLPEWLDQMKTNADAFQFNGFTVGEPEPRFAWKQVRHHSPQTSWPPNGVALHFDYTISKRTDVRVSVHYELYDGVPVMSKWITVHNTGSEPITIDRLTVETLAVVEHSNWVETRDGTAMPQPDSLHVETDFAFGAFQPTVANRHVVQWRTDPDYSTQVNYLRKTPCLLVVEPTYGPAQDVAPGETFESFRTFELLFDSTDRDRRGLAMKRMYRTIAPWVTENPLMMHMRTAQPNAVRDAVDQCAEVGFEMLILSFGSGFNIENESAEYLAMWKEVAEYARSKGIEIGGYSLLASRQVGGGNDVVSPPGESPTFGNCPALTSDWGQDYFRKLYQFYDQTGFTLLEHDGSYPGDVDVTARPPFQKGEQDSRWVQWRIISDFYKWCRGRGIYLNVPDYYYLAGSNKCGMGYREVNWSLPREQQVLHTRQNIYDGTWTKTPSMGWMFVPLTQYHGGGPAATVEPLSEHLDHYELMMASNLGAGVQACYRGPRLYDTEETKLAVKGWVDWYKRYRDILESDIVHGSSRRADGRDLDWLMHANPRLEQKAMLVVFNPLDQPVKRSIPVNLYYSGLTGKATVREKEGEPTRLKLDAHGRSQLEVMLPPRGVTWFVFE